MFKRKPILTGSSDGHQTQLIFELLGGPNEENMPGWERLPAAETVKPMERATGNIDKTFSE
jgi:serine/threonine-protein kinase BUR1